nr:PREDICTED: NHS-like protein 1 isoform X4 [Lepisosteus oculatus]
MPFHQRTVEPLRLCRLNEEDCKMRSLGDRRDGRLVGIDGYKVQKKVLFASLEEVCCHALTSVLCQLSDLSKHASNIFGEIEAEAGLIAQKSTRIQHRLETLQSAVRKLDHKKIKVPVSNLDDESKWTVHYTAPWHQQENVFLPSNRPACVEDLHRQAKVNLKTVLRECDKLRKDGFRSSQYYSQGPTFSSSNLSDSSLPDHEDADKKSTVSSTEEEKLIYSMRPKTPLLGDVSDIDIKTNWTKSLPLPTPEEKMRQQAQAVQADVIPINVTGETFDRQASIRRSLVNTDTVVRRPKKVKRRKTITGVPDNIQKELAGKANGDFRGHSMYIPGQYSTLGRIGSGHSSMRRSETRDSSCQTEEIKIVPPSVRRIRAQKGQGIAAQMAQFSNSSGSISSVTDSAGVIFVPQVNGDNRFHSLPRQGARVSLQTMEQSYSMAHKPDSMSSSTLPRQISKLQADETVVHLRNTPKTGTLPRPKSQEVRSFQSETVTSAACVVSPHATYSTTVIPNATLPSSAEVITIHTTQNSSQLDNQMRSMSSYSDRPLSATGVNSEVALKDDQQFSFTPATTPSRCDSAVSLNTGNNTETESQCSTLDGRKDCGAKDTRSESSYSDNSFQSRSTVPADQWIYDTPENVMPKRSLTSSCSTPVNHIYSSLERSPSKTDTSSLYSMDNDGYYTSMHLDSGIKSRSHNGINGMRHSMYECRDHQSQEDRLSLHSEKSLSRSISLKKAKKPPLPPARTDSLRRKPGKKSHPSGPVLNESLIATLQQSLQLSLKSKSGSSPSQSPSSDYDDPWVLRSRSQSTVSASSSGVSAMGVNVYSICTVTPSHSDTSSVRSEYVEPWCYYMDNSSQQSEQLKSSATPFTDAGAAPVDCSNLPNGSQTSLPHAQDPSVKPKLASSPDKVHRVTSPSSGYSSQSNTPTAGTPVPAFLRSMSPAGGKSKPKVPERKSSLLSSVSISSSSTSLSSNTSDTVKIPAGSNPPPLLQSVLPVAPLLPSDSSPMALPHASPLPPPPPPPNSFISTSITQEHFPPPPAPQLPATPITSPPSKILSPKNPSPPFPPPPPPDFMLDCVSVTQSPPHHLPLPVSTPPPPPAPPLPVMAPPPAPPLPVITPPPPPLPVMAQPPAPPLLAMTPPPAPPLSLKGLKDAIKPASSPSIDNTFTGSKRSVSNPPGEPGKSVMPLITPKALQMVQLRSIKKPGKSNAETIDTTNTQETQEFTDYHKPLTPEKPIKQQHPVLLQQTCLSSSLDGFQKPPAPVKKSQLCSSDDSVFTHLDKAAITGQTDKSAIQNKKLVSSGSTDEPLPVVVDYQTQSQSETMETPPLQGSATKQKPPVFSKKPKLTLIMSPYKPQPASEEENLHSLEADVAQVLSPQNGVSVTTDPLKLSDDEDDNTTMSCTLGAQTTQSDDAPDNQQEEQTISDDKNNSDGDGTGSTTGSISSKDEENGEVFDSDTANSSPPPASRREALDDMVTPTRPRTTEDLFAAIHRSKRKVLGRKESEEERVRSHSPSPPVTPTGGAPGLASLARPTGSIQRSVRKTATSSDSFKALLLKKGSRSETSFRMSATEMLKSTDPRFQRTRSESSPETPDSPGSCSSPCRGRRAQEEWARSEGLLPRLSSSSFSGMKYGRSRTPPSAASSKYNARSRLLSSPMTVICEKEGEQAEAADSCGPADINWDGTLEDQALEDGMANNGDPSPVSETDSASKPQDSDGTLCEEGNS